MGVIANLKVMLSADSAQLKTAFKKTDKESKAWAKKQQQRNKAVAASFKKIAGAATAVGVALGAGTSQAIAYADNLAKTATKLGLTVEQLDKYRFAAEAAGMETRAFDMGIQRFTRRLGEAAQNQGVLKDTFKEMGIAIRDPNGRLRDTEEVLKDYADAIQKTEDPQERLRLAFKAFDAEGVAMVNLMKDGSAGMQELTQRAVDLGAVMDNETASKAEFLTDKMGALTKIVKTKLYTALINGADKHLPKFVRALSVVEGGLLVLKGSVQGWISVWHLFKAGIYSGSATLLELGRVIKGVFSSAVELIPLQIKLMSAHVTRGMAVLISSAIKSIDDGLSQAPDFVKSLFGYEQGAMSSNADGMVALATARIDKLKETIDSKVTELDANSGPSLLETILLGHAEESVKKAGEVASQGATSIMQGIALAMGDEESTASKVNSAVGDGSPSGGSGGDGSPTDEKLKHFQNFMDKMRLQQKKLKNSFGSTWADIAASFGENLNKMGKAGKAFAVGQIVFNTSQAIMAALSDTSVNFYMRLANAGIATMMGAQSLATVKGQFHDGIDSVPSTGTYLLEKGERVVDSRLNGDLKESLKAGNMSNGGTQSITFSVQGVEDPEVINRVIQENRGEFESMLRQINADRAGAGLV